MFALVVYLKHLPTQHAWKWIVLNCSLGKYGIITASSLDIALSGRGEGQIALLLEILFESFETASDIWSSVLTVYLATLLVGLAVRLNRGLNGVAFYKWTLPYACRKRSIGYEPVNSSKDCRTRKFLGLQVFAETEFYNFADIMDLPPCSMKGKDWVDRLAGRDEWRWEL